MRGRKRERTDVFDEGYIRNKRVLQEGIRSLSLADVASESSAKRSEPSYDVFNVHSCPAHGVFRMMMEDQNNCNCPPPQPQSESIRHLGTHRHSSKVIGMDMSAFQSQTSGAKVENKNTARQSGELSDYDYYDEESRNSEQTEILNTLVNYGKRKYMRKVDYLVDELIRKTRKTNEVPQYLREMDTNIPAYVGPSPKTDTALSIIVPFSTEFCSLSKHQKPDSPEMAISHVTKGNSSSTPPILLSGEITHADWNIEENSDYCSSGGDMEDLFGSSNVQKQLFDNADISDGNDSDMACCDESSRQYSSNGSLKSGDSEMMVDSDEEPFPKADLNRQSPWSSSLSASTWLRHPGGGSIFTDMDQDQFQDDENSEDVVNMGTF